MLFIGICGASGSGKSTLAEALRARLGERCYVINQDAYYRDHPQLSFAERSVLNYDEPEIFDHDLLLEDVKALLKGQPHHPQGLRLYPAPPGGHPGIDLSP